MMFTFLPRTISKRWSRIQTDIEDVRELIKREDRTIPVRNQTMAFDRPMIFLGYSVVGIADGKNTNILHKILLEKGTMCLWRTRLDHCSSINYGWIKVYNGVYRLLCLTERQKNLAWKRLIRVKFQPWMDSETGVSRVDPFAKLEKWASAICQSICQRADVSSGRSKRQVWFLFTVGKSDLHQLVW